MPVLDGREAWALGSLGQGLSFEPLHAVQLFELDA